MPVDGDLIDGTKKEEDLALLEKIFDEMEGPVNVIKVMMKRSLLRMNKLKRDILEVEWQQKTTEVLEMEAIEKEVSLEISDKLTILDRIESVLVGDKSAVEAIAKKASKVRHSLKVFENWKPRDSWQFDNCLLTGYDRDIEWRLCNVCSKNTHVFSDSEMVGISAEHSAFYKCRKCLGVTTLPEIISLLLDQIQGLKTRSTDVNFVGIFLSKSIKNLSHISQKIAN
jgi:hypothetical protein